VVTTTLGRASCYDPGPYLHFSTILLPFILCSQSLIPHSFPYAPLGPPPNYLTSYLMDHLTILQSDITCHHSAVRSIPQHHHLTHYGLPAHDALSMSQAVLAPPSLSYKPVTSASRDRGNISHNPTRDLSACDPGKITHDLSRNWSSARSHDKTRFGRTSNLLISTWQIVGMINKTHPLNNQ